MINGPCFHIKSIKCVNCMTIVELAEYLNSSPARYTQTSSGTTTLIKYGTSASQPKDTTGLGEYSDAQLLEELVNRGIMDHTGTNQASELYELCKKVYELTGWDSGKYFEPLKPGGRSSNYPPKYTSDYLLEKLPEWTRVQKIGNDTGKYSASYELDYTTSLGDTALVGSSDTPLKALLKLTIALSEAGELDYE